MGEALTEFEEMELADDILIFTVHAEQLKEFCEKRNIKKDFSKGKIVGTRWYSNFIKHHGDKLKTRPCRMQDRIRLTWCTLKNFSNMYDAVYKAMVKAEVAIKHDKEVMFDSKRKVSEDINKMCGKKARYELTWPDRCVYVDETGCNTNMKEDGHIGGRRYVMAADQIEGARTGVKNYLHFTVLAFTSGTGEAIMCAVILKSEKSVAAIPIS
jgi:hypothetical protein